MAGYNYQMGMSNNAVEAYEEGKTALSNINRQLLDCYGIEIPVWFAKELLKLEIGPCEWHHCGGKGFYNEVDFYHVPELVEYLKTQSIDRLTELKRKWQPKRLKDPIEEVYGYWQVWKSRNSYKWVSGHIAFQGVKKGNWITLPDGKRKKADGQAIEYALLEKLIPNQQPPLIIPRKADVYEGCDLSNIRLILTDWRMAEKKRRKQEKRSKKNEC